VSAPFKIETAEGPLLLADIGGYTAFLQAVAEAHRDDAFADGAVPEAYRLMSSLLDGIVGCIVPPFTLSKIEGDAVFVFAAGAEVPRGAALLDTIRACYADFHARLADVGKIWTCTCTACLRATGLDLKFVLHAGRHVLTAAIRDIDQDGDCCRGPRHADHDAEPAIELSKGRGLERPRHRSLSHVSAFWGRGW